MYFPSRKILLIVLVFVPVFLNAQKWKLWRYEVTGGIATTHYFGDIGGAPTRSNWMGIKDLDIKQTRPSLYMGARYRIKRDFSVKATFVFGLLSGSDVGSVNSVRSYSFSTPFTEVSVQGEYYLMREDKKFMVANLFSKKGLINNNSPLSIYIFGGVGHLAYFPSLKGSTVKNRPFEQVSGYKKSTFVFPLGLGFKYSISNNTSIGYELGGRYVLSDYIDGFSPAASGANDIYYFNVINVIYKLKTSRTGWPELPKLFN